MFCLFNELFLKGMNNLERRTRLVRQGKMINALIFSRTDCRLILLRLIRDENDLIGIGPRHAFDLTILHFTHRSSSTSRRWGRDSKERQCLDLFDHSNPQLTVFLTTHCDGIKTSLTVDRERSLNEAKGLFPSVPKNNDLIREV